MLAQVNPLRGEKHPQSRLSDEQVAQIKLRRASGEKLLAIASDYGVSESLICKITLGSRRTNPEQK